MTIFLDTASIDEIQKYLQWGLIHGCTTNQKIFLKEKGIDFKTRLNYILGVMDPYPVSVELTKTNRSDEVLIDEAKQYNILARNVVVKVPMWGNGRGLRIAKLLLDEEIPVNMTCCMSVNQAILTCELGCDYVSLFYNRIIDYEKAKIGLTKSDFTSLSYKEASRTGETTIHSVRKIIEIQGYKSKIIAGSIRKPEDVKDCFLSGAHIVTITPQVLEKLPFHPKTEETIKEFDEAWKKFTEKV